MMVKELKLTNYRRFKNINLSFSSGINLIAGANASGKTTVVEAIGFAIYGDLLMGDDLIEVLRFNADSCRIELLLSNSEETKVIREIQKSGKTANQKIVLNGEEVKISNLNKIKEAFVDKELFFEVLSVNQLNRHNILDMSQQRFRDLFSSHISPWDINLILDNTKSLCGYQLSRKILLDEKIKEYKSIILNRQSSLENFTALLKEKRELEEKLKEITSEREEIALERKQKEKELRETQEVNKILEDLSKTQKNLLKGLRITRAKLLEKKKLPSSMHPKIEEGLKRYTSKIDFLYDEILGLSNTLVNILELGRECEHDMMSSLRTCSSNLSKTIDSEHRLRLQFDRIDYITRDFQAQEKIVERTSKAFEESKTEKERHETLLLIEERLEKMARNLWKKQFGYFFSRVSDQINEYLEKLNIDVKVYVEDEKMRVLMNNNVVDLHSLSAGERTIINLLSRIALIKRIGKGNLLILDDAVTFLDQKTSLKVFSLLVSLKDDFEQIIVTAHRKDIPVDFDNKIILK
jgi:exonuclease SbcC